MLDFKPFCATTSLANIPCKDPVESCRIMLKSFPEVPCIPRIKMSLRMYMDNIPCLDIDKKKKSLSFDISNESALVNFYDRYLEGDLEYFSMDSKNAPEFFAFLDLIEKSPPKELRVVNIMLVGPLTWGLLVKGKDGKPAWYNETMRDVICKAVIVKAKWQEKKVREVAPKIGTMITLAEPTLNVVSSPFTSINSSDVVDCLNDISLNVDGVLSVHCCDNIDWEVLTRSNVQVINFDAYKFGEKIRLYISEWKRFLNRGGILSWGIVPITEHINDVNVDSLFSMLRNLIESFACEGIDKRLLIERSFITPSCDVSTISLDSASKVFRMTRELSEAIKGRYL